MKSEEEALFQSLHMESYEWAAEAARELTYRMQRAELIAGGVSITRTPGCSPSWGRSCLREHCPVCRLEFRRGLVLEADRLSLARGAFTRVSIVPENCLFPEGQLDAVDLPTLVERFSKQVERSAFSDTMVIGGIDLSFNTFENQPLGWQVQLYLLINRRFTPQLDRDIRAAFPAASDAYRPYAIREVNGGFLKCLTYSYKNRFYTRSGYLEPDRRKADGSPRSNVRAHPLSISREVELAFWLSQYPVGARLILRNVRRTSAPGRRLRLKLLKPIDKGDG